MLYALLKSAQIPAISGPESFNHSGISRVAAGSKMSSMVNPQSAMIPSPGFNKSNNPLIMCNVATILV